MMSSCMEDYYLFEMDQLEKDQIFLQQMIQYDYTCLKENVMIHEAKLTELVKNFFNYIIQKINDLISFMKSFFQKVFSIFSKKIRNTEENIDKALNVTKTEPEFKEFILQNEEIRELNDKYYKLMIDDIDIRRCPMLDIGNNILDLFLDYDKNYEKIKPETSKFCMMFKVNGYAEACGSGDFTVKVFDLSKNKKIGDVSHDKSFMKQAFYQCIYNQDMNEYETGDLTVNTKTLQDFKYTLELMNKGIDKIKNSQKANENELTIVKKRIQNIQKRMDSELVREDLFKMFRSMSNDFLKIFSYNKDILIFATEITEAEISYIDSKINKINKHIEETK